MRNPSPDSAPPAGRYGRTPARLALLCAAAVLTLGQWAAADTVRKRNGTVLQGRILSENEVHVVFEWTEFGACVVKIPRKDIIAITRGTYEPPPVAPTPKPKPDPPAGGDVKPPGILRYCYIPLTGEIGVEVKAEDFEVVVRNVLDYRAEVLVLLFDSPGGSPQETQRILAKMARLKGIRVVALVSRAHSTAAVLAMACPEIFMPANGTIGNVTPYAGRSGKKTSTFSSADLAAFRTVVQVAKHSPLLLEGMINAESELSVTTTGGRPVVVKGTGGKVLKKKGAVLTLTGTEAAACGLARGLAAGIDDVAKVLDAKRSWYHAWAGGQTLMKNRAAKNRLTLLRKEYVASIAPELAALDEKLKSMTETATSLVAERTRLKHKYDSEAVRIIDEYKRQVRRAEDEYWRRLPRPAMRDASPSLYYRQLHDARRDRDRRIDDAEDDRDAAYRRLDSRYKDEFAEIDGRYKRLDQQARQVRAGKKKLLDAGPKAPK